MASVSRLECRSLVKFHHSVTHSGVAQLGTRSLARHASTTATAAKSDGPKKERIVVLGSGWAGYALAETLSPTKSSRVLISPRSHFVFTPLLASTAVGTLEFRTVLEPVRRLGLAEFHQAWASDIDFKRKVIRVEANTREDVGLGVGASAADVPATRQAKGEEFEVPYDKLVLAVGCYSQTFGVEGVKEHASFLRQVGDARAIRLKVLQAFETAELPTTTDEQRAKLLHFVIVGGGPTGIEFAAELHDLVHEDLWKLYPEEIMRHVRITIYDVAPKVLPMFDQNLAAYATEMFRRQGIQVKTQHHPQRIRRDGDVLMLKVQEEPEEVGAGIVVWSTGLMQNPLIGKLLSNEIEGLGRIAKDPKTGGIVTDSNLRVQLQSADEKTTTLPDVYSIGDCTSIQGMKLPATAQVASQQAVYLGKQLNKGGNEPFKFRNWGTMTYLGSQRAIHQSSADELKGRAAWILWRTAYLTKSMSIRNKIMIPVYWAITWIFGRDISRF